MLRFNKDEIKNNLTLEQVAEYVAELGGEPIIRNGYLTCKTICHGGHSHKLYYFANTRLFKCFTECAGDAFDIFDLTRRATLVLSGEECSLLRAIERVARHFGLSAAEEENFDNLQARLADWEILKNYQENNSISKDKKIIEFKNFDEKILQHFPRPIILPWIKEGIAQEVMNARGICYNPISQGIVIPHYDENGALIGIRERTLIKEEEVYGKYRPAIIDGEMYSHPLGFALYNLNNSKENIARMGLAIVFEGEKSTLLYASAFGAENDISVATCGSNLIQHQVDLLRQYGAKEICIAFDKEFREKGDAEFKQWVKKLKALHVKYSKQINISFIFDKEGDLLEYKNAPIDAGAEIFLTLFKNRIRL